MTTAKFSINQEPSKYEFSYSSGIPALLDQLDLVIAISTYQAGKVIFLGPSQNGDCVRQTPVSFKKPMGIALSDNKLAVATLDNIQIFSDSQLLAQNFPYSDDHFDALYLPRATYYSGETDLHDLHFGKGGLWAVNTKFSCISTFDVNYSFRSRWKPPFISKLLPQDRCHLNGMATKDKTPVYATALGMTDTAEGWREHITTGGVLMSVPDGEIILENLPMPHSPRLIGDDLYLLLSASGEIIRYNPQEKGYDTIIQTDAFIRGLAHYDHYLFVGLSKVRQSSKTFNKLPVAKMANHAGILIIDLHTRQKVGEIIYHNTVEEIYDVQVLPGVRFPGLITAEDERHKKAVSLKNNAFWKKEKP